MSKYQLDVQLLLKYIGGKDNISAVSHCMTRMRFVLVDPSKADTDKIESISSVKGTFTQAGQFQVIIGNDVSNFYNEFISFSKIEGVNKEVLKTSAKRNQTTIQRIVGVFGEIFAPIIPALICGGLILGFRNIIGEINFFSEGTKSLADISQFWSGVYNFLWLIGEAVFHMLPVGIVWSITKKMGTTQILGIILGLTLVSPQLLNGFAVATAENIPVWNFGFIQIQMIGYQGQVIAAILAGFVLVYLEKFFKKICPEVISMIVVPFFSLIPAVMIAHVVVGPIGWKIGNAIASVVYMGLTSNIKWLFAAIFGFLYAPIVMTGLHHMTNAIDSQLVNLYDGTILWPMIALSNIAQGSAVLAMSVLQKRNKKAQQINIPAYISCYLGVTEPALFGVNMKYTFPLICGMIGSSIAAIISISTGVEAYSIGVGGLPGILSIKPQFWLSFLLAIGAAIVIPFSLTWFIGKGKLNLKTNENSNLVKERVTDNKLIEFKSPLSGHIIPLEEINDEVFSKGMVGVGVGIEPTENVVLAPYSGIVSAVMEQSGHACGLTLDNGIELLIHVGIDTIHMEGEGFKLHVKQGEVVKEGDKLITFDSEKIFKAGYSITTAFIVTETLDYKFKCITGIDARAGETIVISQE